MPKVVTQRCLEQDLNPRPTDRNPKCLTVAPPRHPVQYILLTRVVDFRDCIFAANCSRFTIRRATLDSCAFRRRSTRVRSPMSRRTLTHSDRLYRRRLCGARRRRRPRRFAVVVELFPLPDEARLPTGRHVQRSCRLSGVSE